MTKAPPRPGEAGTGAVIAASGHASRPAAPVTPASGGIVVSRIVPTHPACCIGAPLWAGQRDAWPVMAANVVTTN